MAINAFKDGVTPLNESTMNPLLTLQPFKIIYEGSWIDGKGASGVTENSLAAYYYAAKFTANGTNNISRVRLNLDKDGSGEDLTLKLCPDTSGSPNRAAPLKTVIIPKEFFTSSAGWPSIPLDVDVTAGANYWIVVEKAGDSTNKLDWLGEATSDGSAKKSSDGTTWSACNTLKFSVYARASGLPVHIIDGGTALTSIEYSSGLPNKIAQYIPPSDGAAGGIRDVVYLNYENGLITEGE